MDVGRGGDVAVAFAFVVEGETAGGGVGGGRWGLRDAAVARGRSEGGSSRVLADDVLDMGENDGGTVRPVSRFCTYSKQTFPFQF